MQVPWIRLTIRAGLNELTTQDYELLENADSMRASERLSMISADVNYQLHLQPTDVIDGTKFEVGVGVYDYGKE